MLLLLSAVLGGCCGSLSIEKHGGVRLVFARDNESAALAGEESIAEVSAVEYERFLARRIRGIGYRISPTVIAIDSDRVEFQLAGAKQEDAEFIKRLIAPQGSLEFIIVANPRDDTQLIEQARQSDDELVRDDNDQLIGRWAIAAVHRNGSLGVDVKDIIRGRNSLGEVVAIEPTDFSDEQWNRMVDEPSAMSEVLDDMDLEDVQVLLRVDSNPRRRVGGRHLQYARADYDEFGNPCVRFEMSHQGAVLLKALTSKNQPDPATGHHRRMAMVMDGQVVSAPRLNSVISQQGQITGDFTQQGTEELVAVLNAGRSPILLKPEPLEETWG